MSLGIVIGMDFFPILKRKLNGRTLRTLLCNEAGGLTLNALVLVSSCAHCLLAWFWHLLRHKYCLESPLIELFTTQCCQIKETKHHKLF